MLELLGLEGERAALRDGCGGKQLAVVALAARDVIHLGGLDHAAQLGEVLRSAASESHARTGQEVPNHRLN